LGTVSKQPVIFFRSHALKKHSEATRCRWLQHFTRHMILPFSGDMVKFALLQSIQKSLEQVLTAIVPMGSIFTIPY